MTKIKSEMWLVPVLTAVLCGLYRLLHLFQPHALFGLFAQAQPINWCEVLIRAFVSSLAFGLCAVLCRRILFKGPSLHKGLALAIFAVGMAGFITAYHLLLADVMGWSELLVRALVSSLTFGAMGLIIHFYAFCATHPDGVSDTQSIGFSLAGLVSGLLACVSVLSTIFRSTIGEALHLLLGYFAFCGIALVVLVALCIWFFFAEKLSAKYE